MGKHADHSLRSQEGTNRPLDALAFEDGRVAAETEGETLECVCGSDLSEFGELSLGGDKVECRDCGFIFEVFP